MFVNETEGRLNFVCAVTDDLIKEKGIKAGVLVKEVASKTGGGGGRPHLATAGGKEPEKLDNAISYLKTLLLKFQ